MLYTNLVSQTITINSDAMIIRAATSADLDAVKACAEQAYALYAPRMGRKPAPMVADFGAQISAGHVHVAEANGAVASIRNPGVFVCWTPAFAGVTRLGVAGDL